MTHDREFHMYRKPGGTFWGFVLYLTFAVCVVLADQWLKELVTDRFALGEYLYVTSFFNLCHVRNTGAAFSFLSGAGGWQMFFFIGVAAVVCSGILVMLWRHNRQGLLSTSLALIMGGAIGNVIDRVMLAGVVDFLDFHWAGYHWPAFNLADIAICVGAFGVVLHEFARKH